MIIQILLALLSIVFNKPTSTTTHKGAFHRALKPKPPNDTIWRYIARIQRRYPNARHWTWDFKGDYIFLKSLDQELSYGLKNFFGGFEHQGCFVLAVSL